VLPDGRCSRPGRKAHTHRVLHASTQGFRCFAGCSLSKRCVRALRIILFWWGSTLELDDWVGWARDLRGVSDSAGDCSLLSMSENEWETASMRTIDRVHHFCHDSARGLVTSVCITGDAGWHAHFAIGQHRLRRSHRAMRLVDSRRCLLDHAASGLAWHVPIDG
jgi:hypothetical protein